MTQPNSSTAPGGYFRRDDRPPITPDSAPRPGAVDGPRLRRTVWPRAIISPRVWTTSEPGYPVAGSYVRTFWTAVLGPGAVADLLRLATAASRDRSLRRPPALSQLTVAGLARESAGHIEVRTVIPPLSSSQLMAMPPAIRRLHDQYTRRADRDRPSAA